MLDFSDTAQRQAIPTAELQRDKKMESPRYFWVKVELETGELAENPLNPTTTPSQPSMKDWVSTLQSKLEGL